MTLSTRNLGTQAFNRLVPMFIQDLTDAIKDSGLKGALVVMPGMFGVGTQTFGGGTWDGLANQLGLPVKNDTLPYTNKTDIYDTGNLYTDVQPYFIGVPAAKVTAQNGFPAYVTSVVQARDAKANLSTLPNAALYTLAATNSNGDSIEQFYAQWQEWLTMKDDPKAQAAFKAKHGETFQQAYPDYEKGNITRAQYSLIEQYKSLPDDQKAAFLAAHPELNSNPQQTYLIANPQQNAQLALWGQADVLTKAAYDDLITLKNTLDIPDNALPKKIPPQTLETSYFSWNDAVNQYGASSPEAKLDRLNDSALEKWGETNLGWKPLTDNKQSLQIQVQYKTQYAQYAAFADPGSPSYIKVDADRTKAQNAYLAANPVFRDQRYIAMGLDMGATPQMALKYAAYRKSTNGIAYREANPDFNVWLMSVEPGLKPLS